MPSQAEMKEYAERLQLSKQRQSPSSPSQLAPTSHLDIPISRSQMYNMLKNAVAEYETPTCRINFSKCDQILFNAVSVEIDGIVRKSIREHEAYPDDPIAHPVMTVEECWMHRPLIRYLVKKHLTDCFKKEAVTDAMYMAEVAAECENRKMPTIEAARWELFAGAGRRKAARRLRGGDETQEEGKAHFILFLKKLHHIRHF